MALFPGVFLLLQMQVYRSLYTGKVGVKNKKELSRKTIDGLCVTCNACGTELPLLHPHIMVERSDDDGNPICDECWEKKRRKEKGEEYKNKQQNN